MNTKIISQNSLDIINQYENFHIKNAICSVPYFNNRTKGIRGGLRVETGKGSPKDIFDEVEQICFREKINLDDFNSETLKKFLVENNIGIDCSAFAYYVLNEESISRKKGTLDRHLSFPYCKGIIGKFKCKIRPVENTNVQTLAHEKNSKIIKTKDLQVGDIVTMIGNVDNKERDHIIIIYQIEYQNFLPTKIHYVHAIAWPSDGEYNHGIHRGIIDILDVEKSIIEQKWEENNKTDMENYTLTKAKNSQTNIRRINWF